jgi:choline transport protein
METQSEKYLEKTVTTTTREALSDEELLAQLGHVQELRREFSVWSLGALCLTLMATWEALGSVVAAALTNGGPPCLFYN